MKQRKRGLALVSGRFGRDLANGSLSRSSSEPEVERSGCLSDG
jgi:hypothetical protein